MRRQAGADSDSRARVTMLRRAALGPSRSGRRDAIDLLALWRTPETQEVLLEAARDREIEIHNVAIQELVTGWPVDSRTRDALGWAVCSSFEWLHNMAFEHLSGNESVGSLQRSTPSTVRRVEDLLLLASWWSEDPDVTAVLQEQAPYHDVIRMASLTNVLSDTSATAETRSLLLSAMHDMCPAVRRLALQGLARMGDPAWIAHALTDSDPYLRSLLCTLRSVTDPSPEFSAELIQALHDEPDDTFSAFIFQIAATRASAGLLEPTALADATRAAPYLTSGDREWLQWLMRATNAAGHASGKADEIS